MDNWLVDVILITALLFISAFFSGSETGLTAISRASIFGMVSKGNKRAKIISELKEKKEDLIGTILLGNNLVNIAATAIATSLAIRLFGNEGVFYVTIILTMLVLIFAEVLPKTIALKYSDQVALFAAPIIMLFVKIFSPITRIVTWVVASIIRLFRFGSSSSDAEMDASDIIRGTIEMHHHDGDVIKQDKDMLGSILDLAEIEVGEVMEHRKHVETIDINLPIHEIIHLAINSAHSRLPFWQDNSDNIIGLLHVKDLIRLLAKNDAKKVTRQMIIDSLNKPWFIPETTSLKKQLLSFRQRHQHFAHVVDEYGDFQGVITLEDIIEEIVGEIRDEYDSDEVDGIEIAEDKESTYLVDGIVTIRDLNRHLDWQLPDDNASTVAGLIIHEARSIPEKGAVFSFHGHQFIIKDKNDNQLLKLQVKKIS